MIANVYDLYTHEPLLTARILGYWSNAFSASVSTFFFCKLSVRLSRDAGHLSPGYPERDKLPS